MSDTPKPTGFAGAGFRAGNARRMEPAALPWPAADWGLWADMPRATLREAVLLSMNLDPRPNFTEKAGRTRPLLSDPGPEFHRRLTLGCAHVGGYGPLRAVRVNQLLGARGDVEVSLPEFRAWAEGLGWPMPELFPGAKGTAPAAEPVPTARQSAETAKDRRARLLEWHEEEEHARGKRGALARVVARETLRRPTADRSNIGTDIRKARAERAQERRAGALLGPLGR